MLDIVEASTADVILFPELSTSGYFFLSKEEALPFGESSDGETAQRFLKLSRESNKLIVYGFVEIKNSATGTQLFNSANIISPDGVKTYRKTHLFYKERLVFDEGDTGFFVFNWKTARIGVMICYDWRFPESARTLALQGADIILCPSNLVTHIWRKVMPTRAIENKVYLAVANRCGEEINGGESVCFNGQSVFFDMNGEVLATANSTDDLVMSVEIDPEVTRKKSFNEFNDIFQDRRPEHYKLS